MTGASPADCESGSVGECDVESTRDAFLGGRFVAIQPKNQHHRSGSDAILLAAATPAGAGHLVDLGAGAGVCGMAVAARLDAMTVTLVERDPALLDFARQTIAANPQFGARVSILAADITWPGQRREAAGLRPNLADHVVANPPFHTSATVRRSPEPGKEDAHVLSADGVEPWIRCAASILKPGGSLSLIYRAEGLVALLDALVGRFGAIEVIPLHARSTTPAKRVVIRARLGRRTPLSLLPPIILHNETGNRYRPEIYAILRDGAPLHPGSGIW